MRKKQHYESPKTELLVVRFEEGILGTGNSGGMTQQGTQKGSVNGFFDGYDYGE